MIERRVWKTNIARGYKSAMFPQFLVADGSQFLSGCLCASATLSALHLTLKRYVHVT